ncbi:hypothetical protein BJY01DRAFT_251513 [Aspergillus pseudoustus]|uniref:Ankyrin repeat-containing domain protein n=1 Tax=Aspergillus pseudoustus TaxID=1810923 RepID=A0ABR4JEF6_9EURO
MTRFLLDAGAECKPEALIQATKYEHKEVVRLLLDAGTKPDPKALVQTVKTSKSIPVAKMLLDARLKLPSCRQTRFGPSAFDLAIGHEALVRVFVGRTTNVEFKERWGYVETASDDMRKALRSGWLQQFEIFHECGLNFGRSQDDSDQNIFATDDVCTYMERQ